MPEVEVVFYKDDDGHAPAERWLKSLDARTQDKCVIRMEMLRDHGHELRRPYSDYLRDGIHELRVKIGKLNYRILYFFHGTTVVVISHGFSKEGRVPPSEIDRAVSRKDKYNRDPERHGTSWELTK